jgi:hypothetical protein
MRVEPDERFIAALDRELQIFNFFIERVMEKIRATNEVPGLQGRLALKAAFLASLETVSWTARFSLPEFGTSSAAKYNALAIASPSYPPHPSAHQAQA